jgi:hypothetical protein
MAVQRQIENGTRGLITETTLIFNKRFDIGELTDTNSNVFHSTNSDKEPNRDFIPDMAFVIYSSDIGDVSDTNSIVNHRSFNKS